MHSRCVIKMQSEENAWKLTWRWNGRRWWCCSFLCTNGHHWFWRQWRMLVTGVGLCLSLLADAFLWRWRRRWWRCDVLAEWMFLPLCCHAISLFSCRLLLWLIPMEENIAPPEEKKLEMKTKGWRQWRGRAGWSLCVFFCLCFFLLLVFVVFFFIHFFSGFLSRASPISPSVFSIFLPLFCFFLFVLPLTRVRLLWEEMVAAVMAGAFSR